MFYLAKIQMLTTSSRILTLIKLIQPLPLFIKALGLYSTKLEIFQIFWPSQNMLTLLKVKIDQ